MYSGPLPGVFFSFDAGVNRALFGSMNSKLFKGIDIEVVQYPMPDIVDLAALEKFWTRSENKAITVYLLPQTMQTSVLLEGNRILWNRFTQHCNHAVMLKSIATVGIDTATLMRRVAADCYLETLQVNKKANDPLRTSLLQVEWAQPGNMVRSIYTQIQNQNEFFMEQGVRKNYVITHHLTDRRLNEKVVTDAQGNPIQDMEGLHNTERFLDVMLRMEKKPVDIVDPFGDKVGKEMGIEATFRKCGIDISLEGSKIVNPTWDSLAKVLNKSLHPKAQIMLRDLED